MEDLQGWFAENNTGLRSEITSEGRDFSRASSLCFSNVCLRAAGELQSGASLHHGEVIQGSGGTQDDTQVRRTPGVRCAPVPVLKWNSAFSCGAGRHLVVLLICSHKLYCSWHFFFAVDMNIETKQVFFHKRLIWSVSGEV